LHSFVFASSLCQRFSPGAGSALAGETEGFLFIAVVQGIDYTKGLIDLKTEVGRFFASGSPEEVQQLQKGDVILVYIDGDEEPPMLQISLTTSEGRPPPLSSTSHVT
jgi:hypothetical protein